MLKWIQHTEYIAGHQQPSAISSISVSAYTKLTDMFSWKIMNTRSEVQKCPTHRSQISWFGPRMKKHPPDLNSTPSYLTQSAHSDAVLSPAGHIHHYIRFAVWRTILNILMKGLCIFFSAYVKDLAWVTVMIFFLDISKKKVRIMHYPPAHWLQFSFHLK